MMMSELSRVITHASAGCTDVDTSMTVESGRESVFATAAAAVRVRQGISAHPQKM